MGDMQSTMKPGNQTEGSLWGPRSCRGNRAGVLEELGQSIRAREERGSERRIKPEYYRWKQIQQKPIKILKDLYCQEVLNIRLKTLGAVKSPFGFQTFENIHFSCVQREEIDNKNS